MKLFKNVFKHLKNYKLIMILSLFFIFAASVLNSFFPLIIGTTVHSIIGSEKDTNAFMGTISKILGGRDFLRQNIWIMALIYILMKILWSSSVFLRRYLAGIAGQKSAENMRNKVYDRIQNLSYDKISKTETGDLLQRCTNDISAFQSMVSETLISMLGNILFVIVSVVNMFLLDIRMAFISLILVPFILIHSFIFFKKIYPVFSEIEKGEAVIISKVEQNLSAYKTIRSLFGQKREIREFEELNRRYCELTLSMERKFNIFWNISDSLCLLQIAVVLVAGIVLYNKNLLEASVFMTFITMAGGFVFPLRDFSRTAVRFLGASFSTKRVDEILSMEVENLHENNIKRDIEGSIEFKNVSFSYEDKKVLDNISFKMNKGESLGILGLTGSGKTTLVNLIPRLYDYDEGHIYIDGVELKEIDKHIIRDRTAVVMQEPFLFNRSVRENVSFKNPLISFDKIEAACRIADIERDILSFEKGYDTIVGEKGVSVSGGQRQRMAIARALLDEAAIIIFDDSLSAVDTQTDINIRKAIGTMNKKASKIIISHRISSLMDCDRIIVISGGRIIEDGSHKELLHNNKMYRRIYDIQNMEVV